MQCWQTGRDQIMNTLYQCTKKGYLRPLFPSVLISFFSIFRQLLERDHSLRVAHDAQLMAAAAHHQQLQEQQEALLRLQGKTPRP